MGKALTLHHLWFPTHCLVIIPEQRPKIKFWVWPNTTFPTKGDYVLGQIASTKIKMLAMHESGPNKSQASLKTVSVF